MFSRAESSRADQTIHRLPKLQLCSGFATGDGGRWAREEWAGSSKTMFGEAKKEEGGVLVPTGFGFLLFGKAPRTVMRQAGLLGLIHYPSGQPERREFDEPAVMIPDQVEKWFKDKLPNVFERGQAHRQERPALPFEMVREAVANALIHRDYRIDGAKPILIT